MLIVVGFLCVPITQTLRFPIYSSMKALFVLPCLPSVLVLVALGGTLDVRSRWTSGAITAAMSIAGILIVAGVLLLSKEAWQQGLSGPMWSLPIVN